MVTKIDVEVLEVLQNAYRKHHLGHEHIGWNELSDQLQNVLCNIMGDDAFVEWLNSFEDIT